MEDLSDRSEVNRITIRQIENDEVQPQEKTMARIYGAFDKFGVEFLPDDGVKMRKQETRYYSGKTGYRQILEHIYDTVKNGGVIRQFNFGDLRYAPHEEGFVAEHIGRLSLIKGLDAKVLEQPGETSHLVGYCSYRTLDKQFKNMAPWYLYGDYLVHSTSEKDGKLELVSIQSKLLAERYLREFDIFWNLANPTGAKKKGK